MSEGATRLSIRKPSAPSRNSISAISSVRPRQREAAAMQRRGALARVVERAGGERDGAIDRGGKARRDAFQLGRGARRDTVGQEPHRREDVLQIVIDLGDGGTERGEPLFLEQRLAHGFLHHRQLALGLAELVAAPRRPMTRVASSGSSRNLIMPWVRRRIGPTSSHCRLTIDQRGSDQRDHERNAEEADRQRPTSLRAAASRRAAPRP